MTPTIKRHRHRSKKCHRKLLDEGEGVVALPVDDPVIDDRALSAAREYIARRDRQSHPDGKKDGAGRWYPSATEDPRGTIRRTVRTPSRAWPWSYAHACRSAAHVAELYGVDVALLRRTARMLDRSADVVVSTQPVFTADDTHRKICWDEIVDVTTRQYVAA